MCREIWTGFYWRVSRFYDSVLDFSSTPVEPSRSFLLKRKSDFVESFTHPWIIWVKWFWKPRHAFKLTKMKDWLLIERSSHFSYKLANTKGAYYYQPAFSDRKPLWRLTKLTISVFPQNKSMIVLFYLIIVFQST